MINENLERVYQCGHCGLVHTTFNNCENCCNCVELSWKCKKCGALLLDCRFNCLHNKSSPTTQKEKKE